MTDDLVKRIRDLAEEWHEMCDDIHEPLTEAASRIEDLEAQLKTVLDREAETHRRHDAKVEAQAAEIERLRKAGTNLAGYAGHDDNCEIMLKGVWSDPIPCTCGYEDAWKAWAALGETQ
jgi:hypothetical protein